MTDDEIARAVGRASQKYGYNGCTVYMLSSPGVSEMTMYMPSLPDARDEADRLNGLNAIAVYRRLTEGK